LPLRAPPVMKIICAILLSLPWYTGCVR